MFGAYWEFPPAATQRGGLDGMVSGGGGAALLSLPGPRDVGADHAVLELQVVPVSGVGGQDHRGWRGGVAVHSGIQLSLRSRRARIFAETKWILVVRKEPPLM